MSLEQGLDKVAKYIRVFGILLYFFDSFLMDFVFMLHLRSLLPKVQNWCKVAKYITIFGILLTFCSVLGSFSHGICLHQGLGKVAKYING